MKQHTPDEIASLEDASQQLARAFLTLNHESECLALLEDLCTPAELEAMVDRWRVALLLERGLPYREIHERTGVSVTTIGRVARFLSRGAGGYRLALSRLSNTSIAGKQPATSTLQSKESS
ncbi:MAG: YerC/YecD family TrpR-related protein [Wenzhouxiangellaceae bacterium]